MKAANIQTQRVSPFSVADLQARINEQRKDRASARIVRAKDNNIHKARSVMLQEHATAKNQIGDMKHKGMVAGIVALVGIASSAFSALGAAGGVAGIIGKAVSLALTLSSSVVNAAFNNKSAESASEAAEMRLNLAGEKQLKIELERELKKLEDQETDFAAQRDEAQQLANRLNEHLNRVAELTA